MPRIAGVSTPTYRLHRTSGQAVVTIYGHDNYLGPWKSKASHIEYDRLIGEWLANGRRSTPPEQDDDRGLTVIELAAKYLGWAKTYYIKNGEVTKSYDRAKVAVQALLDVYGEVYARDFGPMGLREIQDRLVREGTKPQRCPKRARKVLARSFINDLVTIVKHVFRWGVSQQLVPIGVYQSLTTVDGLRRGRTAAREPAPVRAVPDAIVDATLPYLPPVIADIVRLMRLTGARPGEAMSMRPRDIDRSAAVWIYTPASHKTEHHGHERRVTIGPRAQAILAPYLDRDDGEYCFQPIESRRQQLAGMRAARKTKVQPSQQDRRKPQPKRQPGQRYTKDSFAWAIRRACDKAKVERWRPNQLRHSFATEVRRHFRLDAVQATLGHSSAKVSEVYAEVAAELSAQVAAACG